MAYFLGKFTTCDRNCTQQIGGLSNGALVKLPCGKKELPVMMTVRIRETVI